jgi:predicted aldo/keto reductase-like oxidoreductase
MDRHRKDFFLATKTGERTYKAAKEQLHRSLERLHVDHVDLIQLHYLVPEAEWATAMGPDGALEALVEARDEGLVRFIGVTGHDWTVPKMHLRSLERFDFDTVLLPYSYIVMQNTQYAADFEQLLQVCQTRNVAVQTIKSISRGPWPESAARTHATWYEPMSEQSEIDLAVSWVLGRAGVFLNTVGDIHLLPKVLDAAARFQSRPESEAMAAQMERQSMAPIFTS